MRHASVIVMRPSERTQRRVAKVWQDHRLKLTGSQGFLSETIARSNSSETFEIFSAIDRRVQRPQGQVDMKGRPNSNLTLNRNSPVVSVHYVFHNLGT